MRVHKFLFYLLVILATSACAAQKTDESITDQTNTTTFGTELPVPTGYANEASFLSLVGRGDLEQVKTFVANGAPVNLIDRNGVHLAIHAVQSNNPALVDYLALQGMDLNGYGHVTYTPILLAVRKHPDMVGVFIRHKANLDLVSKYSSNYSPAITWGVMKRASVNVVTLIESGADVNVLDSFGIPPILYAFNQQDLLVMKAIFKHGGNPSYVDSAGNSLVVAAIKMGNLNLLRVLVDAGADLEARDADGNTPLSLAIISGNSQIVQYVKRQLGIT